MLGNPSHYHCSKQSSMLYCNGKSIQLILLQSVITSDISAKHGLITFIPIVIFMAPPDGKAPKICKTDIPVSSLFFVPCA